MSDDTRIRRRRLVAATGSVFAASLAGCAGSDSTEETSGATDSRSDGTAGESSAETDEDVVDRTDQDLVRVDVGAGSGFEFDPAEIRISPGTTVRWIWTGKGGGHNVVASAGGFASHDNRNTTAEAGYSFQHRFTESGSYEYVCQPHSKQGMIGSIEVVE